MSAVVVLSAPGNEMVGGFVGYRVFCFQLDPSGSRDGRPWIPLKLALKSRIPSRAIESEANFDEQDFELAAGDQPEHPGDTTERHAERRMEEGEVDKLTRVSLASRMRCQPIV